MRPERLNALDRLASTTRAPARAPPPTSSASCPSPISASTCSTSGSRNWKTYLTDLWVVAESLAWNGAIQDIVRRAVRRPRPFLYSPGVYPNDRDSPEAGFSFYSGHTSFAFALATSASYTFTLRHPH